MMITKWRYFDDDGIPTFYNSGIETNADNVVDALNAIENQFADLQVHITSLEAENAALRERLSAYEVGYDPKVKLPEFVDGYGWVLAQMHREQTPSMYHYSSVQDSWQDVDLDSYPTSKIYRWFPLPGAKEEK